VPRIVKDCFGTVIATLTKMKECVRCELLSECRSINWSLTEGDAAQAVMRKPDGPTAGADNAAFARKTGAGSGR
jgi:hypothetical protein